MPEVRSQRPAPWESAASARNLARTDPWRCLWRAQPDGSLEVAYLADRQNVLVSIAADGRQEEVARSARQGDLSKVLELGLYVAFGGFVVTFTTWWGLAPLAGGIAAFIAGDRLDEQPDLREWVRERHGPLADWISMPRTVGAPTPTANQLLTVCRLSDESQFDTGYRVLPDETVQIARRRSFGFDISTIDYLGDLHVSHTVALERKTWGRLAKTDGGGPWNFVRTDPPSDD